MNLDWTNSRLKEIDSFLFSKTMKRGPIVNWVDGILKLATLTTKYFTLIIATPSFFEEYIFNIVGISFSQKLKLLLWNRIYKVAIKAQHEHCKISPTTLSL